MDRNSSFSKTRHKLSRTSKPRYTSDLARSPSGNPRGIQRDSYPDSDFRLRAQTPGSSARIGSVLTEDQILEAVAEKCTGEAVSRETLLGALLSEDEADLIVCLRRERDEQELPWEAVREDLLDSGDPKDSLPDIGAP